MRRSLRPLTFATAALFLALGLVFVLSPAREARSDHNPVCKPGQVQRPDGSQCKSGYDCCSRICIREKVFPRPLYGTCCTPTTCSAAGAICGTIPNGNCPNTLDCGPCEETSTTTSTSSTTSSTAVICPTCAEWVRDPCNVLVCQSGCETTTACQKAQAIDSCSPPLTCCQFASSCEGAIGRTCPTEAAECQAN